MTRALALLSAPLLLGLAAATLGSPALFAVALGLVAVYAGSAAATWIAVRRLTVLRTLDRREVLEGQPLTLAFRVGGLHGLPVQVEIRDVDGHWRPLASGSDSIACTIDRPGAHVIESSRLRVRDDLGLMPPRAVRGGRPEAVLVLPLPLPAPARGPHGGADPTGSLDPDGLRPYVPGTPTNRIHWASVARGGELQERSFAPARDHLPLVVVDTGAGADDAAVDWASRVAAGHVLTFARTGGCRLLLPGDRAPTTIADTVGQWPAAHRRLAALRRDVVVPAMARGDHDALYVRAASAPPDASGERRPLPPGVVPLAGWAGSA